MSSRRTIFTRRVSYRTTETSGRQLEQAAAQFPIPAHMANALQQAASFVDDSHALNTVINSLNSGTLRVAAPIPVPNRPPPPPPLTTVKVPSTKKIGDTKRCPICIADYNEGEEATILPCSHNFHTNCISKWFETSLTCPLCRFRIGHSI